MCHIDKLGVDYSAMATVGFAHNGRYIEVHTRHLDDNSKQAAFVKNLDGDILAMFPVGPTLDPKLPYDVYTRVLVGLAREALEESPQTY